MFNASHIKPPHLVLLVLLSAVNPLSLNIFMPSMPGIMRVFETDYATVQLTLTLFLTAIALSQLVLGPLSDRYGRRPVVLVGMILFLLGSTLCIYAPTIEGLIFGRIIQAVGGCTGMVMSRAIVRDMHGLDKSASMIGYVVMAMVVVPMFAPSIGGLLDRDYGWQASFILVLAYGGMVTGLAWLWLGETHTGPYRAESPKVMLTGFAELLKRFRFLCPSLQIAFSSAAFFAFLGGAPYVVMELMGGTPVQYGIYFMIASTCYMFGNFVTGRRSEMWGAARLIKLGLSVAMTGGVWLFANHYLVGLTPLTLFVGMGLFAIGNGLSLPSGMAQAISADPERIGAAAGLSGFMQLGAGAISSYLAGLFLGASALPLITIMTVCAVLAIVSQMCGELFERRGRA